MAAVNSSILCMMPIFAMIFPFFFRCDQPTKGQNSPMWNKHWKAFPDTKIHGNNMGPTWALSAPDGPYVGPMNLAIRVTLLNTVTDMARCNAVLFDGTKSYPRTHNLSMCWSSVLDRCRWKISLLCLPPSLQWRNMSFIASQITDNSGVYSIASSS